MPSSDSSEVAGGGSMVERTMRDEPMWDQPEVHDVYRRWHDVLAKYDGDRMLVAEAWTQTPESMARFVRPDEMSQAFNFAWLLADWSADAFAEVVTGTLAAVGAGRRHPDLGAQQPRRRPARDPLRRRRAGPGPRPGGHADDAGAARLVVPLPGRGARPRAGRRRRRSSARTRPGSAPASPAATAAGCRSRGAATPRRTASARATGQPWIPQPDDWAALTVEAQAGDPASTLSFYRAALPPGAAFAATAGDGRRDARPRRATCWRSAAAPLTVVLNCGTAPVAAARRRGADRQRPGRRRRCPADTAVWLR